MAVMDRLRQLGERRENVVACAFGPGISLEMMLLRRPRKVDDQVDDQVDGLLTEDVD